MWVRDLRKNVHVWLSVQKSRKDKSESEDANYPLGLVKTQLEKKKE